ncbi:MAG: hypothetical protein AMS15_09210 [Planctomycetes bacterium DG_23]|nr:MAG: hypothetical protein AMS15_09210 [Planctomycetes bacterium DG_23]
MEREMIICPGCGRENRAFYQTCAFCGRPLLIEEERKPKPLQTFSPRRGRIIWLVFFNTLFVIPILGAVFSLARKGEWFFLFFALLPILAAALVVYKLIKALASSVAVDEEGISVRNERIDWRKVKEVRLFKRGKRTPEFVLKRKYAKYEKKLKRKRQVHRSIWTRPIYLFRLRRRSEEDLDARIAQELLKEIFLGYEAVKIKPGRYFHDAPQEVPVTKWTEIYLHTLRDSPLLLKEIITRAQEAEVDDLLKEVVEERKMKKGT